MHSLIEAWGILVERLIFELLVQPNYEFLTQSAPRNVMSSQFLLHMQHPELRQHAYKLY